MKQNITTVGIELAKKIFHLVGMDTAGKADYAAQHVSARAAERCLRQATEMVATIVAVLESL